MRNHKICKKAILKFNISWRHNINDFLMYNVLFVQKSSVYNASLTNFRAKKIRELATKKNFYFLFFFSQYALPMVKIWKESEITATTSVVLIKNRSYAIHKCNALPQPGLERAPFWLQSGRAIDWALTSQLHLAKVQLARSHFKLNCVTAFRNENF